MRMILAPTSRLIAILLTRRVNPPIVAHFVMVEAALLSHVVVDVVVVVVFLPVLDEVDEAVDEEMHRTRVHATAVGWQTTMLTHAIF